MMTNSYQFESSVRTVPDPAIASVHSAMSALQTAKREDIEERRWQIEWERRNVED